MWDVGCGVRHNIMSAGSLRGCPVRCLRENDEPTTGEANAVAKPTERVLCALTGTAMRAGIRAGRVARRASQIFSGVGCVWCWTCYPLAQVTPGKTRTEDVGRSRRTRAKGRACELSARRFCGVVNSANAGALCARGWYAECTHLVGGNE